MHYPYLIYSQRARVKPLFEGLTGDPFMLDLSRQNPLLDRIDVREQRLFQALLGEQMGTTFRWGFAGYLEERNSLLRDCPQMVEENRFCHLGVDIIVPFGTKLHAPLEGRVADSGYEAGEGNYGGFVLLKHEMEGCDPFYSFYGHLRRGWLPRAGEHFAAGEVFAAIGDFNENGNGFHHTHLQIITEPGIAAGYASKGYCTLADLMHMNGLCPSPFALFRV